MKDIFRLFHVETKEDAYTYCLIEMLECGGDDFKARVGTQFGIDGTDYKVKRAAFEIRNEKTNRNWIIPDLVLYNQSQIAVVESKMFSSEGYAQTQDYEKGIASLKKSLEVDDTSDVSFYYITLSGVESGSTLFKAIKWSEFYSSILDGIKFEDECLELIRKTILDQVSRYKRFETELSSKAYEELFDPEKYWITPFSIFASGAYDNVWKAISGKEEFVIGNYMVRGRGHASFTTNLNKNSWWVKGSGHDDNLHLFIRIEWFNWGPAVWLCWEYFNNEDNYIAIKNLTPKEFHDRAVSDLIRYKEIWEAEHPLLSLSVQTTNKKANSIKPLKCQLSGDKTIAETIEEIKAVVTYYSEEIERIVSALAVKDGYLSFVDESYKTALTSYTSAN